MPYSYASNRRDFLKQTLAALASTSGLYSLSTTLQAANFPSNANVRFLNRNDKDYLKHRQIFNKRITAMPKVIAVCANEQGVQSALKYAQAESLSVAIKSGGHSFEGFSTNDNGLMLDLSAMNNMRYDKTNQHLVIQPGAKLGRVYEYLNQYGRLIPAGSCAGVGVAGLTLGGGYGFFGRQLGLTCDSLLRVKMLDGQGNLQDSKHEPDLLWACKGGGNGNFGVVTELEFITHPAPKTFSSYRYKYHNLSAAKAVSLAERWFSLMANLPNTAYSSWVLNGKNLTILITDTALNPTNALKTILTALSKQASDIMSPRKDNFLAGIQRYRGGTEPIYFKNVSAGYYADYASIQAALPEICQKIISAKLTTLLQINTLGGMINNSEQTPKAAYPHRQYAFLGELQTYYDRANQTSIAEQIVNDIQGLFRKAGIKAHYRNYPDIGIQEWQKAYYGDNYLKLQTLKHKWDPHDLIHHPQSIRL
jgi:FAD/FMN-containing dehydrogenase